MYAFGPTAIVGKQTCINLNNEYLQVWFTMPKKKIRKQVDKFANKINQILNNPHV